MSRGIFARSVRWLRSNVTAGQDGELSAGLEDFGGYQRRRNTESYIGYICHGGQTRGGKERGGAKDQNEKDERNGKRNRQDKGQRNEAEDGLSILMPVKVWRKAVKR